MPRFFGSDMRFAGLPFFPAYAVTPTGSGTGVITVTHSLGSQDVNVIVRRITGTPLGAVGVRWWPTDNNNVNIDFDTYARGVGEFRVTVLRLA